MSMCQGCSRFALSPEVNGENMITHKGPYKNRKRVWCTWEKREEKKQTLGANTSLLVKWLCDCIYFIFGSCTFFTCSTLLPILCRQLIPSSHVSFYSVKERGGDVLSSHTPVPHCALLSCRDLMLCLFWSNYHMLRTEPFNAAIQTLTLNKSLNHQATASCFSDECLVLISLFFMENDPHVKSEQGHTGTFSTFIPYYQLWNDVTNICFFVIILPSIHFPKIVTLSEKWKGKTLQSG